MKKLLIITCAVLISAAHPNFSQKTLGQKTSPPAASNASAELEKKAVRMLREAVSETENLRLVENKVYFANDLASLLWRHDEPEARRMFRKITADFTNLLLQFSQELGDSTVSSDYRQMQRAGRGDLMMQFFNLTSVRRQIALAIAEHDAELALEFTAETSKILAPKIAKDEFLFESNEDLENAIIQKMPVKNAGKALQIGKEKLKKGFSEALFALAQKIHREDDTLGREFAGEIVAQIKSDQKKNRPSVLAEVLNFGKEQLESFKENPTEKIIFSESHLRDIAEILAQNLLASVENEASEEMFDRSEMATYAESIEPFSAARAAQVRARFELKQNSAEGTGAGTGTAVATATIGSGGKATVTSVLADMEVEEATTPEQKAFLEKQITEKKMYEDLNSLGTKKLSKEQREELIARSRRIIASMGDANQKIGALSLLAAQMQKHGEQELAKDLMGQAESLANPQPVNYEDFIQIWMLAGGYAEIDAEKSFTILETTIYRLNETIAAMIKVGEFMDVHETFISDGEVRLAAFDGGFTRGMLGAIGQTDAVLEILAAKDFERTANLSDKFQRPEARLLARLLILQSILKEEPPENKTDSETLDTDKTTVTTVSAPSGDNE